MGFQPSKLQPKDISLLESLGIVLNQALFYVIAISLLRGEILEVLDDSRKWWKARNWRGQVAHVPHTIVSEIGHTNGRDPHMGSASPNDDWIRRERQGKKGEFRYF